MQLLAKNRGTVTKTERHKDFFILSVFVSLWLNIKPMEIFLQQLINGIVLGSIYALIALGYTMVYGVLRLINFAHGDVFMVGAFIGFYFAALAKIAEPSVPGALFVLMISMLGAAVLGIAIE